MQRAKSILSAVGYGRRCLAVISQEVFLTQHSARIQQVAVHLLPGSYALSGVKSHNRPKRDHASRRKVGWRELREEHRRIPPSPLRELQAHPSLRQRIDSGPVSVRSRPAEGCRVRLNQARIEPLQFLAAKSHAVRSARPHIRQQDVGFGSNSLRDYLPFRRLRVCGYGALIGIEIQEVLRSRRPRYVAVWRLELDNVGSQVSQALARRRPRYDISHLHDSHAVQRRLVITTFDLGRLRKVNTPNLCQHRIRILPSHRSSAANFPGRLGKLDRVPHLSNIANYRIAHPQEHVVGDYLRVVHRLVRRAGARVRHVSILEYALPLGARLCLEYARNDVEQLGARLFAFRSPAVTIARIGEQFGDVHHGRGYVHESSVNTANLNPISVRALEHAVKGSAARGRKLERSLLQMLPNDLRSEHQRAGHNRRVHLAPITRPLSCVQ